MIQPGGAVACLEAGRFFLADFLSRLLQPLGVPRGEAGLVPSDAGLFEFLIACLLERANRDLAFPFQFEAGPCGARPGYLPETRGLSLAFSVRLLGLTGAFRLFMPFELVGLFRDRAPRVDQPPVGSPVSWPFPLSAGHVDLTYEEMFGLEPHDVVLFESEPMLLVPGAWDCGWKLSPDGGNACRYGVDKYVRGEHLDESQPMPAEQPVTRTLPDLGRLPVRLNVVLGEKELTFAQANGLVSGSIIELERGKADPVDLAINGKVVGTGQLVEVEGRLGVKILAWRGAA
jgi:type III secretion system YscQ/HrcQ family protein